MRDTAHQRYVLAVNEPPKSRTDAAIVALADYAAREILAEIRRGEFEQPMGDAPVVGLIRRLAAELRAEGQTLPQAVERLLDTASPPPTDYA